MGKKLLIFPGLILGLAILVILVKAKEAPQRTKITEHAKAVRAITLSETNFIPRAVGYGYVHPDKTWEAVAEIGGKIVEIHPNLKKGVFLNKGETLFKIEANPSRLAIEEIQAEILNIKAQIAKLEQNLTDTKRQLEIERSSLKINQSELDRKIKLFREGVVSKSDLDLEKQRVLIQKNSVENYLSTINRIPSERQALFANLRATQSRLANAKINLEKTIVTVPFDSRIAQVNVELGQAATVGQILAIADSIKTAEIEAQIPRYKLRNLIPKDAPESLDLEAFRNITRGDLEKFFGFNAIVRIDINSRSIEWKARFLRFTETDPKTGTIGIVVAVDDPFLKAKPGKRPPLQKNYYCEVELYGKPRPNSLIIPRSALHQNLVYVVNQESRLEKRKVQIEFFQEDLVSIQSGLNSGEQIIVSDVIPAIEGMLLTVHLDKKLESSLSNKSSQILKKNESQ